MVRRQIRWAVFSAALLILGILMTANPALASIANVYIAQSAAGTQDGSSCANAFAATFFNTAGNWGSGSSQIGAGTIVHICGTWTGAANSTLLTFLGDGANGNVITLLFEPGALMQAPYFQRAGGAINLNGHSHILIDGGVICGIVNGVEVPVNQCNGTIQNTDDGTNLTYQQNSSAIYGGSGINASDIEIRNLVTKLYTRVDSHNNSHAADGAGVFAIWFDHAGLTNVNIHHCNIQHDSEAITIDFEGHNLSGITMANNYVNDMHWGLVIAGASNNTTATGIVLHDNEITNWSNWVSPSTTFHGNGIMLFNASCTGCSIGDANSLIYNNYVHGDLTGGFSGSSPTAMISPQDNTQGFQIFNNLVVDTCSGAGYSCGPAIWMLGPNSVNMSVYNNTIVNTGNGGAGLWAGSYSGTNGIIAKNNVFSGVAYPFYVNDNSWTELTTDYNDAYGTTDWICVNTGAGPPSCLTLSQYQSQHSGDLHSSTGNPNLTSSYKLDSGSAAVGLGTNLTSLGITALNKDAAGSGRPSSGAWDAGAYQSGSTSAVAPSAPAGLTATVN